jgi:hypothetical protein
VKHGDNPVPHPNIPGRQAKTISASGMMRLKSSIIICCIIIFAESFFRAISGLGFSSCGNHGATRLWAACFHAADETEAWLSDRGNNKTEAQLGLGFCSNI